MTAGARDCPESLAVAVRAHAVPASSAAGRKSGRSAQPSNRPARTPAEGRGPQALLVFDTETLVDESQALTFGCWRYYRRTRGKTRWACLEEGLLYADELPTTDPAGFAALRAYADRHKANSDRGNRNVLALLSRAEFVEQKLFGAGWLGKARVVGFNLPFDLSRLAIGWTEGRGRNLNGFSFILAAGTNGHPERKHRPRVQIKHLTSHRAQISFSSALGQREKWLGDFVDLRTLTFALTGVGHSLQSACAAFGVAGKADPGEHGVITEQYINYCRQDVAATANLYIAAEAELISLNLPITPPYAYSPASLAKAVLRGLGVQPVLRRQPDTDPELMGLAMSAFYGGRAECRIRKTEVPISLLDFTSTYPTLFALMGLWSYVIAEHIDAIRGPDAIAKVRTLIDDFDLGRGFDPALWPQTVGYALIDADDDVLPVRAQYDSNKPGWNIGVNRLTTRPGEPLWYALGDILASKLLTGRTPHIIDAVLLTANGTADGLRPLTLPGGRTIDPALDDPWLAMTEERQRVKNDATFDEQTRGRLQRFLKITSNAGSYGIWAEYNQRDLPKGRKRPITVHSGDGNSFTTHVHAPEDPGTFCYPPLAAPLTAGARLLLALLEKTVTDAGGSWAFADTDSMAIVAKPAGGLVPCAGGRHDLDGQPAVRALSPLQIAQIRERFTGLNPYAQTVIAGSILKHELDAYGYVIAAKRYALYRYADDGLPRLVPSAEHEPCSHGLGHLINPGDPDENADDKRWIVQLWEHELATALTSDRAGTQPAWYDRPAIARITATSPRLLAPFRAADKRRPYPHAVKPFNFLMFAPGATLTDASDVLLVAPWTQASRWGQLDWINIKNAASRHRLTMMRERAGCAVTASWRAYALKYLLHPETKSRATHHEPCQAWTVGLLHRRRALADHRSLIGKEANRLEEREAGLANASDVSEALTTYAVTTPATSESLGSGASRSRPLERILKSRDTPRPHS
jgi:hypothetical protein